ncbi:hypothetical protein FJK98_11340 [Micromonospora sp. HM134]|uniref:hypothetical protein n=1 Tax=Micromonospora sp. HM134 TaxID=2583243 RepID=UPI001198809E|nr:hypothetical protein [Micromonospora sp. HM134]QDY07692.1 hypothetical protein FJK98_11340 [Micromonospora sp. HM134]
MTGPFRPGPPPVGTPGPSVGRPGPSGVRTPGPPPVGGRDDEVDDARHPAVDAAVRAMANAEGLSPADQIAQYEAAYQTLRETLATIDQT